jgi:hypothetical protein
MTALADEYRDGYIWLFEGISPEDQSTFVSVACVLMEGVRTIGC